MGYHKCPECDCESFYYYRSQQEAVYIDKSGNTTDIIAQGHDDYDDTVLCAECGAEANWIIGENKPKEPEKIDENCKLCDDNG